VNIRAAGPRDHEALLALWLASVRATHRFLNEAEIQALLPSVSAYLGSPGHPVRVLYEGRVPIGFMGLDGSSIASLFIAPSWMRQGGGRALLAHARASTTDRLSVDVNEENVEALAFYRASGFSIVGRSPIDDQGGPHPLLHLREDGATTNASRESA
jgi:putative acetyltransferase